MTRIDSDFFLSDILEKFPKAADVFETNGLGNFIYDDNMMQIAPFVKLKTLLRKMNINEKSFINLLEEKIESNYFDFNFKQLEMDVNDRMNLLALLPCPLKVPIQEAFYQFVQKEYQGNRSELDYLIEGNANNQLSYYDYVDLYENIDEIPDIIISPGINSFYYKRFIDKFIDKGFFTDTAEYMPDGHLTNVDIKDPGGNYTIISMNVLVMVVDKLKAENMPIPKTWGDILNPEYEKKVAIRGQGKFFCETTLLTIYKQYGLDGIRKLGKSVKYGWHPAQMVKHAGSGNEDSPAVSIMPYFYTKTIKNKDNVIVVWPEDGAIVSPVTMLVKSGKAEKLKKITDFFTSREVAKICSGAYFPSLHPEACNKIPEGAVFNWLGWDFIKQNDIGKMLADVSDEFLKSFQA